MRDSFTMWIKTYASDNSYFLATAIQNYCLTVNLYPASGGLASVAFRRVKGNTLTVVQDASADFVPTSGELTAYQGFINPILTETFSNPLGDADALSLLAGEIPGIHNLAEHPITKTQQEIYSIIMDLNDCHGKTREEIAEWLDKLDNVPRFL